ncbi:LADA_0A00892g1_1 [Lachancea dasiensis]|uniref:Mediator of RNA polymerase II transcription subunit 17 n=1 Tax=Lachancea dasiensis TaxID=1072105 RepID=A0A1G4IM75_9SACH|nr:LADA_0A00892g1_1 [Lachancea dasiensis]
MVENQSKADHVVNEDVRKIPLAIDPNLIRPLPSFVPPTNDIGSEDQLDNNTEQTPAASQSLINNPYETYGNLPLDKLIPIILQSRGPGSKFADLSEEALLEEIAKEPTQTHSIANGDIDIDMNDSEATGSAGDQILIPQPIEGTLNEDEENDMTHEQFQQLRKNAVLSLDLALNESSLALEFVSLLLSSVRPSAATASMSPFLKKTVPSASLNAEKVPYEKPKESEIMEGNLVTKGWKLRSLEESRLLMKETHKALELTVEREQNYWSKLSHYISRKDVVFRMKDKETGERTLGLKYGYEDSGSRYKQERGIAILRHEPKNNTLEIVPSETQQASALGRLNQERFLRVRIFNKIEEEDDYILSGETSLDELLIPSNNLAEEQDIRRQIARLQFFIFEKELMFHMKKEAANLISYGVSIENENKITVEFATEKMEFEMISLTDDIVMNRQQDAPKTNDKKARLILVMLRMLLVTMFKKQLKRNLVLEQKGESAPKNSPRSQNHEVLLLRPILGKFRHANYLDLLQNVVKTYVLDVVEGATLKDSTIEKTKSSDTFGEQGFDKHIVKLDREIKLFESILRKPRTYLTLLLPSAGEIEFGLESSNYCNASTTVKYINDSGTTLFNTKFSNFKELEDFLHFIVSEYVKENGTQV